MKFSTRTTYGLRAMINLAKNQNKSALSLAIIAANEKISLSYLERIFSILKKNGLVKSEKGKSGGYKLSKKARQIKVFDIVKSLEGETSPFHCLSENGKINCSQSCNCGATKVLINIQIAINNSLKKMKLSDLI